VEYMLLVVASLSVLAASGVLGLNRCPLSPQCVMHCSFDLRPFWHGAYVWLKLCQDMMVKRSHIHRCYLISTVIIEGELPHYEATLPNIV
jgi:hypothetical protein